MVGIDSYRNNNLWLKSRAWDLSLLTFSGVLSIFPHALYSWMGFKPWMVGLTVALLVGGPHIYATFTRILLDKSFTQRFSNYIFIVFAVIPVAVVYLLITRQVLLLTIFFFWASMHVLHQIAYVVELYNQKMPVRIPNIRRAAEYFLVFTSLYPFAISKLVSGNFYIGTKKLLFPQFMAGPAIPILVWTVFGLSLLVVIYHSLRDWIRERRIYPKTYLLGVTVVVCGIAPTFPDLDVAFQGVNIWHSFQYLALTYYITRLKKAEGLLREKPVARVIEKRQGLNFYLFHVGITLLAGVAVVALYKFSGLSWQMAYWAVIFSSLLVHYFFDHILFTEFRLFKTRLKAEPALA